MSVPHLMAGQPLVLHPQSTFQQAGHCLLPHIHAQRWVPPEDLVGSLESHQARHILVFVTDLFIANLDGKEYPKWAFDLLKAVNINIFKDCAIRVLLNLHHSTHGMKLGILPEVFILSSKS